MPLQWLKQWASTTRLMMTLRKRGASDNALSMLVVSTDESLQRKRTDEDLTEPAPAIRRMSLFLVTQLRYLKRKISKEWQYCRWEC
jgi:hypothetical protein